MDVHILYILLVCCIHHVCSQLYGREAPDMDMTEPCRYAVAVGIEREYIPSRNLWATSKTNEARGPEYARLYGWKGGGAWTAGIPNTDQHIGVDLGYRHVITSVATQGRRGSDEYVLEYYLEFSSDNRTWSMYTNKYGTPLMFDGNRDDDTPKRNELQYPIVARYVRFNPQRWHQFISMRIELYGCRFDGEGATFDGASIITYDISGTNQYTQTRTDHLKMRFLTNQQDGMLFFADGNQGDYIVLEMLSGRLHFHIDLGSTATASGDTSMRAGSLLDDNQWHDVEIVRVGREVNFTVDRLTVTNITNGDFFQLDLDRRIYLGGLDSFLHPGKRLNVRSNFSGCMENVWYNNMNMIKDARMSQPRFQMHGAITIDLCQVDPVVPYTFPTLESHISMTSVQAPRFRLGFHFRTYNKGGLLFTHKLSTGGKIMMKVNEDGYLAYSVHTGNKDEPTVSSIISNMDPRAESRVFTDGLWHAVIVDVQSGGEQRIGKINFTVDGRPDVSNRQLTFTTSTDPYLIGGGDAEGGENGFLGCMRYLEIGTERIDRIPPEANKGVINGTCSVQDRCDPNPCEHGGICSQDYMSFSCNCDGTGYEGGVCHKSKYLVSCEEVRERNPTIPELETIIDIDDSGPLEPFSVKCVFQHENEVATAEVRHQHMKPTVVNGYIEAGSYVRPIVYDARTREQFDEIIARAHRCEQYIKYKCYNSRLLSDPGTGDPNKPSWGWWVGRTNLNMRYWGSSSPGSGKCQCALKNECKKNDPRCNCDAGLAEDDVFDDGFLRHKEHLPVMELRFGDTGTLNDEKWGEHTLGPLRCEGDNMFDNMVTFRKQDATIEFPTFEAATSGDIRLQFKTTAENGIILQNTGPSHFVEVKLVFGNTIHFRFNVGNGIQTVERTTTYPMNDDEWHTIHVERNRKQAMLRVDQQEKSVLEEQTDQSFRSLHLTSNLVIGASVDYKDGFVGCMRGLMVNGVIMDMHGKVERGEVTYGVSAGCHPKCASNPCMNNGICVEWYSHYQCDCAYTPYRGWVCGREVGANMQPDYMIKFEFDRESGQIATDEENIIIGFSSQTKQGQLMLIRNDDKVKPEYISVEMNNNGGVKVALDVGFDRDELNCDIKNVDLANGQQHVVRVNRYNKGRSLRIKVDNYPEETKHWTHLPDSADTRLDNPRFIYFGRNESTRPGDGFKGCLFRAQFDNVYPLKRVFQDPRPPNIYLEPKAKIREDMCAFEEVTHKADPPEFRPTPTPGINATHPGGLPEYGAGGLSTSEQWTMGGILAVALLILIALAFMCGKYYSPHKGNYETHEAKDAKLFDSPDYAVASGTAGHPEIEKKKEWYI